MKCTKCNKPLYSNKLVKCPFCGEVLDKRDSVRSENIDSQMDVPEELMFGKRRISSRGEMPNFTAPLEEKEKALKSGDVELKNEFDVNGPISNDRLSPLPLDSKAKVEHKEVDGNGKTVSNQSNNASIKGFLGTKKLSIKDDATSASFKKAIFKNERRKKKERDSKNSTDITESIVNVEEEIYDTNYDGYYDDLIPELAREINKIPTDNKVKAVIMMGFVVIMIIVILYTS